MSGYNKEKKDIEWLEVLKGACCTSNNLQNSLSRIARSARPQNDNEREILHMMFGECEIRMQPLVDIPEIAEARRSLADFMDNQFKNATYGEMQKAAYDAHVVIDDEYYKHYADKMGIVENPRK